MSRRETTNEDGLTDKIKQAAIWLVLSKIILQAFRWSVTFIVIRLLTPDDYGLAAISEVIIGFSLIFASENLTASIIQKKEVSGSELSELFGFTLILGLLITAIIYFSAPLLGEYFEENRLIHLLQISVIGVMAAVLSTLPSSILVKKMDFKTLSIIQVVSSLSGSLGTLVLALQGHGVYSLIIGQIITLSVRFLLLWSWKPLLIKPSFFKISNIKDQLFFNMSLLLSGILWLAYSKVDVVVGGKLMSISDLGIYAVALQLAVLPVNKIMPIVKQVAFPAYSTIQDNANRRNILFIKSNTLALFILLPIIFGLSSTSNQWVPLVLGNRWNDIVLPLLVLSFSVPFRVVLELINPLLKSLGNSNEILINMGVVLLFMTPASYFAAQISIIALCTAWATIFPLIASFLLIRTLRLLKISLNQYFRGVFPSIAAAATMTVCILQIDNQFLNIDSLYILLIKVLVGIVSYFTIIKILGAEEITMALRLIRK